MITTKRIGHALLAGTAAVVLTVACSSSSDRTPEDPSGSCDLLASRCHHYDKVSQLAHDCHELGHAGDDHACFPKKDACLAECPPFDAAKPDTSQPTDDGSTSSDGAADAPAMDASDGATDICPAYCQCLMDTCSGVANYPFAAAGSCLAACATYTTDQKACWPGFCDKAKNGMLHDHNCEHSWGAYDLDECP